MKLLMFNVLVPRPDGVLDRGLDGGVGHVAAEQIAIGLDVQAALRSRKIGRQLLVRERTNAAARGGWTLLSRPHSTSAHMIIRSRTSQPDWTRAAPQCHRAHAARDRGIPL